MKRHQIALAAGFAIVAGKASATEYAYCSITAGNYDWYVSGVVEIGSAIEDYQAFERGFGSEFRNYGSGAYGDATFQGCHSEKSILRVQEIWQSQETATREKGRSFTRTGWTGGRPPAVDRGSSTSRGSAQPSAASGTQSRLNRAQDDAAILEAQKDAAAAIAKRVADAARNSSQVQAQIAKFMAELKKRGSAQ